MGLCYASLVYSPLNPCSVCLSVYSTAAHFFSNSHTHFLSKIYHNIIVSYVVFSSISLYLLLRLIKSLVSLLLPHTTSFPPPSTPFSFLYPSLLCSSSSSSSPILLLSLPHVHSPYNLLLSLLHPSLHSLLPPFLILVSSPPLTCHFFLSLFFSSFVSFHGCV